MSLEQGTFITDLVKDNPTGADPVSSGDDHIRLIKKVLLETFPNLDKAVVATPDELNGGTMPAGSMIMYGGYKLPEGWLLCDGATLSKSTYETLYEAIGETWGSVSPNEFNLPDMRNRVPGGALTLDTSGGYAGKNTHNIDDVIKHSHTTATDGGHAHGFKINDGSKVGPYSQRLDIEMASYYTKIDNTLVQHGGAHAHTINDAGTKANVDNRQATAYVNYIIKHGN